MAWTTPSGAVKTPTSERLEEIRNNPDDFRVTERIPLDADSLPLTLGRRGEDDTVITFLDTETTSTDTKTAKVIELGMLRCRFNSGGRLVEISKSFSEFDDPGIPIPQEVTRLTGITNKDVQGKRLDAHMIQEWLGEDPLVVAHNAKFDRPIFERRFPALNDYRWACSLRGIPWRDLGYPSASLPMLLMQEGWFFEAHRARDDCLAVSWLLHMVDGALGQLLQSTTSHRVMVGGKTWPIKDKIKELRYQWEPNGKYWHKIVPSNESSQEVALLERLSPGLDVTVQQIGARTAFK